MNETDELVAIVDRGMAVAVRATSAELASRLAATERLQGAHRSAGRGIEAAACEIRAQAFREAIAVLKGKALAPLRMYQLAGVRTAEARSGTGTHPG